MDNRERVQFVSAVIRRLSAEFLVPVSVSVATGNKCCLDWRANSILFGLASMEAHDRIGFKEYDSCGWVWGATVCGRHGKRALWAICLHEYAHRLDYDALIQARQNGASGSEQWLAITHGKSSTKTRVDMHGARFQQTLAAVIQRVGLEPPADL